MTAREVRTYDSAARFGIDFHRRWERMMTLTINGEQVRLDNPPTIEELLIRYNLSGAACAVEVNRQLIPKRRHAEHPLADGDTIEIVTLVGGG